MIIAADGTRFCRQRRHSALSFLWPWLVGLALLYFFPLIAASVVAFTDWDGLSWHKARWVGFSNYRALFTDATFRKALGNSVGYTIMNVSAQTVVGLTLAVLVCHSRKHKGAWATLYYLPHVLGGTATILIWGWLLNPRIGPINEVVGALIGAIDGPLRTIGFQGTRNWELPPWLFSPSWAKPSLILMNLWQAGGAMLICLAALLRADPVLHEAARLDGATAVRRFFHITLHQVSPAILFIVATGIVSSMQAFVQPFLLSNYQQEDGLLFYAVYLYQCAFERHRFGYAAAMAWGLFAMLLVFTIMTVLATRKWIRYDMEEGANA